MSKVPARPATSALAAIALLVTATLAPVGARAQQDSGEETAGEQDGQQSRGLPKLRAPDEYRPARFQISLGPLFAARSMTMEGDNQKIVHKPQPYAGVQMGAAGTLAEFPKIQAALKLEGEIGYGAAKNRTFVPGEAPPVTELAFGGVRTVLMRRLGKHVAAGFGVGFQGTSILVQPNSLYTGHRYLAGDSMVRISWLARPGILEVSGQAGAFPVFATNNSNSAHGEALSFGGSVGLEADFNLTPGMGERPAQGLHLVTRYRYDRYRARFPLSPFGPSGAHSVDNLHMLSILIDYSIPTLGE